MTEPTIAPPSTIASTTSDISNASNVNSKLFWKHELHLRADLPIGPEVGLSYVVIRGHLRIHRQLAEVEDVADAAADRYCPLVAAAGAPIDGEDRTRCQIRAALEVVIQE